MSAAGLFRREQPPQEPLARVKSSAKRFAANPSEIIMFTRTVAAALTVAIVAGSTLAAPTEASARAGRNKAAVVGAIVGLSGALIAGSAAARSHGYRPHREHRKDGYGGYFRASRPVRDCFTRPIMRWNAYYGERVIVGHRRVCR